MADPRFAQLEQLDLGTVTGLDVLADANWESLRCLTFDGKVALKGWRALTRSAGFRGLVNLSASGVGPKHVAELASAPGLAGLRELRLDHPLGTAGAHALAEAPWLDGLITLSLDQADLDDDGLIALLAGLKSGTLAELSLSGNRIGPRGGRALLDWPGLPHLVGLDVDKQALGTDLADRLQAIVRAGPR